MSWEKYLARTAEAQKQMIARIALHTDRRQREEQAIRQLYNGLMPLPATVEEDSSAGMTRWRACFPTTTAVWGRMYALQTQAEKYNRKFDLAKQEGKPPPRMEARPQKVLYKCTCPTCGQTHNVFSEKS